MAIVITAFQPEPSTAYEQNKLLYFPTQKRFPIGGERVKCCGSKLTNSQGKQQH